ncbi:hypothetical protein ACQ86B_24495 [Mycolicibacterium aichiense]|uniref:hypothetical protein n=1 Tax=Mycolicibacterium aichiense TaxID=1799 RepID=UPI003D668E1D
MSKKLAIGALVVAGLAVGPAPMAQADDINRQVCLAVMAMGVKPGDGYALTMVQSHPDMTYSQATALVYRAYSSVQWHANPMCNGVTIPADY